MRYFWPAIVALVAAPLAVLAQDGSVDGPTSSSDAAGYSCDASKCKLPTCNCATTSPPGGLSPSDVPQFITFTADDAVQSYTLDSVNQFLAHRVNPNGCAPKMTYFTSLNYTNYTLVTDWFVAGNEIADHTMTHVGIPPQDEINGNLIALNALAGIPLKDIIGFRAPFLSYSVDTLKMLHASGFTYDSSSASSLPINASYTDAFWPYTLDNGMANDCLSVQGQCKGEPKLPGFWEIPMYSLFDSRGVDGIHLMDPWLDFPNGETKVDDQATLQYMKDTFMTHYNGDRQPFGLYTHPIHLSTTYPGVNAPQSTIDMINQFLDWAQQQPNVWIVSNAQMLSWIQNPKPISQLGDVDALKCSTPAVDASVKMCNGIPQNEAGLLSHCAFSDFPFYTCYGCPSVQPSPDNPNPDQSPASGDTIRHRLPDNCYTAFWDPIAGNCSCTSSSCQFNDVSKASGPNGQNLTGNDTAAASETTGPSYVPFNEASSLAPFMPAVVATMIVALLGSAVGAQFVVDRL